MNGVLVVDKPTDFTSFDVVAKLRGMLKQKKIGHGGTLDPQATGVLPIFFGNATKLCDYLPYDEKTYAVELTLGIETDTEDIFGTVLKTSAVHVTETQLEKAILSFVGDYDQIPPMYSAKQVDGRRLYDMAREGIVIERKAVPVFIEKITDIVIDLPKATFKVSCSKGTYIRTLCKDIGEKLGCGGCMSALRREQHGIFTLHAAHTLEEIEKARDWGTVEDFLIPTEDLFPTWPKISVKPEGKLHLENGNYLYPEELNEVLDLSSIEDGAKFRVYAPEKEFKAIYEYRKAEEKFVSHKMFL